MGIHRSALLLVVGAAAFAAAPGTEAPPLPSDNSATVTVTAEATAVERIKTPNPVLVLDKATLEARGAANLGDLLQGSLPGQVFASGGVGTATTLMLGGGRTQDTVVTLDGIRLTDVSGLGGVNLSAISLAGIERIEIQQGPCSTRFGSDAQAGVVAMYSAGHVPDGYSGQVRAGMGNMNIREGGIAPAYGWGSGWVRASLSAQQENGALPADHAYRTTGAFLGLGQQLGTDTLVTLSYLNAYSGVPIPILSTSPNSYDAARQDFSRMQVVSGTLRSALTSTLSTELTLGQVLQTRLEPNYLDNSPTDRYLSRRNQANGTLTWRPSKEFSFQAGFEASEERAYVSDYQDFASARHLALLLEGAAEITQNLRLVGSVRGQQDRLAVPTSMGANQNDDVSKTTWKLGLNYLLGRGLRFYASTGTAFANPLLYSAIYNAHYQGQPLDNERSTTSQTGLTWEQGPWTAGLELSRTRYANLVFFNPNGGQWVNAYGGYWTGIYQNGSDLRLQSAQLTGGYQTAAWGLRGYYRNQEFRDQQAAPDLAFQANAVLRRPFQSLGLSGYRSFGDVRIEASWSWIGSRYDYSYPAAIPFNQHFNDLSLNASWNLRQDLTLTLRGNHLMQPRTSVAQWLSGSQAFRNDASQIYGYPAQPPTCTVEMRYRF